jgi:cytochrome c
MKNCAIILLTGMLLSTTPAQAVPNALGERLMLRCQICHAVTANAPAKVGPNLNKLFGRKAGLVPGFRYSTAMLKSTVIWNEASLDKWLVKPTAFIPGTTMAFVGLPRTEDRAALIAYLKRATK